MNITKEIIEIRSCIEILANIKIYSVSEKNSPWGYLNFIHFFTNGWEFLIDFLHTYYTF